MPSTPWIHRAAQLFRRGKWIILLSLLAGLSSGWAYTTHQPIMYQVHVSYKLVPQFTLANLLQQEKFTWTSYFATLYPVGGEEHDENLRIRAKRRITSQEFIRKLLRKAYPGVQQYPLTVRDRLRSNLSISVTSSIHHIHYRTRFPKEGLRVVDTILKVAREHVSQTYLSNLSLTQRTARRLLRQGNFEKSKRKQLRKRINQAQVMLRIEEAAQRFGENIETVNPPSLSREKRAWTRNLLVGGLSGGVLGILLTVCIAFWDRRFRTTQDVNQHVNASLLGILPQVKPADQRNQGSHILEEPDSPYAESIRRLRASLNVPLKAGNYKSVLVTSPLPQEGKTTTACNLARAFSLEKHRTLLVDFDLRKGNIHELTGVSSRPGLTSLLQSEADVSEALIETANLDVLPRGAKSPHPLEIATMSKLRHFFHQLETDYTRIVVDGTHVIGLADMVRASQLVDLVLVVLRAGYSKTVPSQTALNQLKDTGATIAGVVLNGLDSSHYSVSQDTELSTYSTADIA